MTVPFRHRLDAMYQIACKILEKEPNASATHSEKLQAVAMHVVKLQGMIDSYWGDGGRPKS